MSFLSNSITRITRTAQTNPHLQIQIRNASGRSERGLYNGRDIRAGNNVPFSLKKTKRTFKPNVFKKRLYSEILSQMIPFHVTTSALRSIDKAGGLDTYLLENAIKKGYTKAGNNEGWLARERILQKIQDCERKGRSVLGEVVLKDDKGGKKVVNMGTSVSMGITGAESV